MDTFKTIKETVLEDTQYYTSTEVEVKYLEDATNEELTEDYFTVTEFKTIPKTIVEGGMFMDTLRGVYLEFLLEKYGHCYENWPIMNHSCIMTMISRTEFISYWH